MSKLTLSLDIWHTPGPWWLCLEIPILYWAVHTWQLISLSESKREPERVSKTKARIFCNLILEVTSYYFYYIVFFRNESLGPDHTQKERITKRYEYSKARITGGHFRGCLPQHHQFSVGFLLPSKAKVFLLFFFFVVMHFFPLHQFLSFSAFTTSFFSISCEAL